MVPQTSFMMGGKRSPVHILHWKALWQKDVDEHFQDVQDVHPNYWTDFYWFARPTDQSPSVVSPYRVPDSFQNPVSHQWFTARQAGNPMARFHRTRPVEELTAEGFGSLATQDQCDTQAKGAWRDGRWYVAFVRPMVTDDREDVQLYAGSHSQLGVAIWDGSAQNVGGRKQYSDWIAIEVMP
jgi:DMSO reductase family type II enzyme heme b subunit